LFFEVAIAVAKVANYFFDFEELGGKGLGFRVRGGGIASNKNS